MSKDYPWKSRFDLTVDLIQVDLELSGSFEFSAVSGFLVNRSWCRWSIAE